MARVGVEERGCEAVPYWWGLHTIKMAVAGGYYGKGGFLVMHRSKQPIFKHSRARTRQMILVGLSPIADKHLRGTGVGHQEQYRSYA